MVIYVLLVCKITSITVLGEVAVFELFISVMTPKRMIKRKRLFFFTALKSNKKYDMNNEFGKTKKKNQATEFKK